MTNGTSQGLFIVVAIIIFGIFVSMSYLVFGNTLQPALAGIFETALGNSDGRINMERYTKVYSDFSLIDNDVTDIVTISKTTSKIQYTTEDTVDFGNGIAFESVDFRPKREYVIAFNVTLVDGYIDSIGGHLPIAENLAYFINDEFYPASDSMITKRSVPLDIKKGETVNVKVYFDTTHMGISPDYMFDKRICIQPNRFSGMENRTGYNVILDNIEVHERINPKDL